MQWIFQFIFRHRAVSSLFLTVVLSLLMLSATAARQQQVARALMMTIFYPFQFTLSLTSNVRNSFSENKKLRKEVAALTNQLAQYRQEAAENARLRTMIEFSDSMPIDLLPARVVLREPAPNYRSIAINVGSKQGVKLSMPVMTYHGAVGKVMQVMPHFSLVQLFQDPSCRVSVMVERSRGVGIMGTDNGHDFSFKCRSHIEVAKGDRVVTSGLGGVYPRGLDIGGVTGVVEDANPLFKKVSVRPYADLDRLEEVFVVRIQPQWAAFPQEADSLELHE
jgi:rod shape-determining protein MreC